MVISWVISLKVEKQKPGRVDSCHVNVKTQNLIKPLFGIRHYFNVNNIHLLESSLWGDAWGFFFKQTFSN